MLELDEIFRPYPTENEMRAGWLGRLNELQITSESAIPAELITEAVPLSVREGPVPTTSLDQVNGINSQAEIIAASSNRVSLIRKDLKMV